MPWGHAVTSTPHSLGLLHVCLNPPERPPVHTQHFTSRLGLHTCTLTHICTHSVCQISKFLLVSNLGDLLQFLVGAGGSTKEVFLEGHRTGGSGYTWLLPFLYQMLSGYRLVQRAETKQRPIIPQTGLQGQLGPSSGDLYRVTW